MEQAARQQQGNKHLDDYKETLKYQVYNRLVGWSRVYLMEKVGANTQKISKQWRAKSKENRAGRRGVDREPPNAILGRGERQWNPPPPRKRGHCT